MNEWIAECTRAYRAAVIAYEDAYKLVEAHRRQSVTLEANLSTLSAIVAEEEERMLKAIRGES